MTDDRIGLFWNGLLTFRAFLACRFATLRHCGRYWGPGEFPPDPPAEPEAFKFSSEKKERGETRGKADLTLQPEENKK